MAEINSSRWIIDPGHSQLQFRVRHLAISTITGTFRVFEGEVNSEGDHFDNAKVHCVIKADTIDTNNPIRDKDLKSEVFLDAGQFPEIIFDGKLQGENDQYKLIGTLSLHGIAQDISMDAAFTGTGVGRFSPQTRAGFEVTGKINRKDFGISWHMLTEAGGIIIGEDVRLQLDIQLAKQ